MGILTGAWNGTSRELYAKVTSRPLTALKTSSKCSFIPYKFRFLVSFRLVGRSRYAAELATLTGLGDTGYDWR
uniref:Uncharacterized protein n=1 Tax=Candidatus Kentrum sp. DK TaxID=2126562 RepID=A0A450S172_9GAMM|nr:MAG: hypothetical protein BECKDK2373C_GA0170839_10111 [Candidatus Kentron sp. DK]